MAKAGPVTAAPRPRGRPPRAENIVPCKVLVTYVPGDLVLRACNACVVQYRTSAIMFCIKCASLFVQIYQSALELCTCNITLYYVLFVNVCSFKLCCIVTMIIILFFDYAYKVHLFILLYQIIKGIRKTKTFFVGYLLID